MQKIEMGILFCKIAFLFNRKNSSDDLYDNGSCICYPGV